MRLKTEENNMKYRHKQKPSNTMLRRDKSQDEINQKFYAQLQHAQFKRLGKTIEH